MRRVIPVASVPACWASFRRAQQGFLEIAQAAKKLLISSDSEEANQERQAYLTQVIAQGRIATENFRLLCEFISDIQQAQQAQEPAQPQPSNKTTPSYPPMSRRSNSPRRTR